jgi:hypothetical protein
MRFFAAECSGRQGWYRVHEMILVSVKVIY